MQIEANSTGIYYFSEGMLVHTNFAGEEVWKRSAVIDATTFALSDSMICTFGGSSAVVIGANQEEYFTLTPSDFIIQDAICGANTIAFLTQSKKEDGGSALRIFDLEGTEIQRTDTTNMQLLKYGLSGASDNLWILVLDTTGVEPISRISISNPSQDKLTGIIEVSDQLISDVFYYNADMFVAGGSNLLRYNTFNEKQSETLTYGLRCVDSLFTEQNAFFAFIPNNVYPGSSTYTMRLITSPATQYSAQDTLLQLPQGIFSFAIGKDRLYCFSTQSIYSYKLTGEFDRQIPVKQNIDNVTRLTNTLVMITSGTDAYFMDL